MIRFTADYGDRDEIEALGAKWDFTHWKWCIPDNADYSKFKKWLGDKVVVCSELYIVETKMNCPFCGKPIRVAGVAFGEYYENYSTVKYGKDYLNFLGGFERLSGGALGILKRNFAVEKRYSEGFGYKYYTNGCRSCGGAIPDLYLYGESSPFKADTREQGANLIIYEVPITNEVLLGGNAAWSVSFENIRKFARFADFSRLK